MKKIFTLIAVAVMAFAAQAEVLSVCRNGGWTSGRIPIYGFGYDTPSLTQQIYPAYMLADMAGKEITEISFFAHSIVDGTPYGLDFSDDFIKMEGGEITLALMEVDQQFFTEAVAMSGATVVATTVPEYGSNKLTFALDEPFTYNGGNLLVEVTVTEYGTWYDDTWFAGSNHYNCTYLANGNYPAELSGFLCTADFTYEENTTPPTPGGKTDAPSSSKDNYAYNDGNLVYNAYTVNLIETEPSDIYYRVGIMVDGDYVYGDWMLYTGELNFTDEGIYMIEAYAIAPGKTESDHIWDGFTVSKMVDVEELMAGKTVSSVRYYNVAGQEMAQPSGLTIMVTTFTDGTTSAVKVVK